MDNLWLLAPVTHPTMHNLFLELETLQPLQNQTILVLLTSR